MSQIIEVNAFKVVNTIAKTTAGGKRPDFLRSALLNESAAVVNYGLTKTGNQQLYTGPSIVGTPIIAFDDAAAALEFAAKHPGRAVYHLHGYAKLVIPVTDVLKLRLGWDRKAAEFWKAVVDGADLSRFITRSAPEHSIGIFGVVTLLDRITRIPPAQPVQAVGSDSAYAPIR